MSNTTPNDLEIQLVKIASGLDSLNEKLASHTDQDMTQFNVIFERVDVLDEKLDALLLREAHQQGEKDAARRLNVLVAGVVSSVVSIVGAFIMKAFGV